MHVFFIFMLNNVRKKSIIEKSKYHWCSMPILVFLRILPTAHRYFSLVCVILCKEV